MRKFVLAASLLALTCSALADISVPNSRVSYALKKDPVTGGNASMVFIDALADQSGKTYLAFVCDGGEPFARLYSKVTLGVVGDYPASYFSADGGPIRRVVGIVRDDLQSGKPNVLDSTRGSTAELMRTLIAAHKVALRVERRDYSALTLTFPAAGFTAAWRAIRNCD